MKTQTTKRRGVLGWLRRRREEHHAHQTHCTSLCCAHSGQTLCVARLTGEAHEAGCLRDLGVREGAVVTVLRHGDPLLVKVGDARFGIGRNAAQNVLCEAHEDESHEPERTELQSPSTHASNT